MNWIRERDMVNKTYDKYKDIISRADLHDLIDCAWRYTRKNTSDPNVLTIELGRIGTLRISPSQSKKYLIDMQERIDKLSEKVNNPHSPPDVVTEGVQKLDEYNHAKEVVTQRLEEYYRRLV